MEEQVQSCQFLYCANLYRPVQISTFTDVALAHDHQAGAMGMPGRYPSPASLGFGPHARFLNSDVHQWYPINLNCYLTLIPRRERERIPAVLTEVVTPNMPQWIV